MHVIQLPNGNLLVPESVLADEGQLIGDAYVEIGPADADYDRLAAHAITEDELEAQRRRWREGDAEVSPLHANFINNVGGATARDVATLLARVRRAVLDRCGVELRLEVHLVGVFIDAT